MDRQHSFLKDEGYYIVTKRVYMYMFPYSFNATYAGEQLQCVHQHLWRFHDYTSFHRDVRNTYSQKCAFFVQYKLRGNMYM